MEDQLEGFHITFDTNGNVTFPDEGFDEVVVNLVRIETFYLKCHSSFPSRSKLYKHIKASYIGETSRSFSTQFSSSILVVASMAVYQSFGSSLAFRAWIYATTAITLNPHYLPRDPGLESTACFDMGCKVTLVDKSWLSRQLPGQKISTMSTPLKVRGIGAPRHESEEFAALSLY